MKSISLASHELDRYICAQAVLYNDYVVPLLQDVLICHTYKGALDPKHTFELILRVLQRGSLIVIRNKVQRPAVLQLLCNFPDVSKGFYRSQPCLLFRYLFSVPL